MTQIIESVGKDAVSANSAGKWRARLIEADVRGSSAYYSSEVLEAGAPLFKKGTQMFMNHMTKEETELRPEGDVRNLIGVLESDAVMESDGLYADLTIFSHHKTMLKEMAPYIGLSIKAHGSVEESDSGPVLKEFTSVESVDVVTKAGAGGMFVSLAESAKPGVLEDTASVEEAHTESKELQMEQEVREAFDKIEAVLAGLPTAISTAVAEAMKPSEVEGEQVAEAEVEAEKVAPADVLEALVAADLPKTARARLVAQEFASAEALAEAIKAEKDAVDEVLESAKAVSGDFKVVESTSAQGFDHAKAVWG